MTRSATLSTDALLGNLQDLLLHHGENSVLDLRSDALGLGVSVVSTHAKDLGFTTAVLSPRDVDRSALPPAPTGSVAHQDWWGGPAGEVMTFSADIISLKRVPGGSPVSYGYRYRTTGETTLALVAAGYADGVPRTASGFAQVSISGSLFIVAGRVAMDQCVIDIGDHPAQVGDQAVVWGENPTLTQWSQWSSRPPAALLTRIGARVVKQWI
jgi:alanine racemase